jgi:hypothetical protein
MDMDLVDKRYRYLIAKCTEKNPDRRYQTIQEIIDDFNKITNDEIITDRTTALADQLNNLFLGVPSKDGASEINKILLENLDNEELYLQFFPQVTGEFLSTYLIHEPNGFRSVLNQYDDYVSGSLSFNYCDVVANLYREIYSNLERPDVRKLVLTRLLDIGISHNRYYAQNVFCSLIASIEDHSTALVAIEMIRENRQQIQPLKSQILDEKPLKIIANVLSEDP